MKRIFLTLVAIGLLGNVFSQNTKTITFTALCTDSSYVQLSSVKVGKLDFVFLHSRLHTVLQLTLFSKRNKFEKRRDKNYNLKHQRSFLTRLQII